VDRRIALAPVIVASALACGSSQDPEAAAAPAGDGVVTFKADFEDASPRCNDWTTEGASAIRSIPPRSGDYACKVCSTGFAPQLALAHTSGPIEPGHYTLTAWVRKHTPGPDAATVSIEADTPDGVVARKSDPTKLDDDYAKLVTEIDLGADHASAVRVKIEAAAFYSDCLYVDDVSLERR
jgi:hypothetical protein